MDPIALAAAHDLSLDPDSVSVNEAGLDFRVVMADDADGVTWVLRIPRRPDVAQEAEKEARILELVRPALAELDIAVPDWRIRSQELIAYPALPGHPGLTLDGADPIWHMDPASPDYATRLGKLLAALHSIGPDQARAAGVEVRSPDDVRRQWQDDMDRVRAEFAVAPGLDEAWRAWIDDDASWPAHTVMSHGEIYPAHVLLDDGRITGVLDWTTARVDDPARDFSFQIGAAGDAMLQVTVDAYVEAGGRTWPGLAAQARRLWDASPIPYALFALVTGDPMHRAGAEAMLNPDT
ncbi:macrolide 2'-phosphotransferase [Microbacterium sp. G2-8]|uniref:macrolide 2'-phosphotransferase n=1 Tax=Microbacterium sp. G2-8 TaxID=2842454 RepID=UPI0027E2B60E|nr:macrolide 2'-phosphotransferase [Microbacterium sp. G2-8]